MISSITEYFNCINSNLREEQKRVLYEVLSDEVIQNIITDYPDYKSWIIHNKHIPLEVIENLCNDPDPDVRFTIAMKRKCNINIFRTLKSDSDVSVRIAVVRNPNTPVEILHQMTDDLDEKVSEIAKKRLVKNK